MRPFFSYYGGKWRLAPRYPKPQHATIIEPFAGSAGYSLRHYARNVVLYDVDPIIAGVWRYLLRVKPEEVLALPDIEPGQTRDDVKAPQEARWLIGFWLNKAAAAPCRIPGAWMRSGVRPRSFWGPQVRERIASQVEHIRHWRIVEASYEQAPDVAATWFVDPPYQGTPGRHYRHNAVDFAALGAWCRARRGQVIACENVGADWLPFRFFRDAKAHHKTKRSLEAVWLSGADEAGAEGSGDRLGAHGLLIHEGPEVGRDAGALLDGDGAPRVVAADLVDQGVEVEVGEVLEGARVVHADSVATGGFQSHGTVSTADAGRDASHSDTAAPGVRP